MEAIRVRPVYDSRRSLRGYVWGIYSGTTLTAICTRYPTEIMKELT